MYTLLNEIPASIFRAYDIRGSVDDALSENAVYSIGRAIATQIQNMPIVVGRDCRLSSPTLCKALMQGLLSGGCDITDLGIVSTPVLYFATHYLPIHSGIMVTGSHNPPTDNGLKIVLKGKTMTEHEIKALYQQIQAGHYLEGQGKATQTNLISAYINSITERISLSRPLKVVIDCGNGATSHIAPKLFERLGCHIIPLYCKLDGNFPNHHPDPSVAENLAPLIEAVKQNKADVGLAFDGDGDRLGVVSKAGEIIWPDRQLILFANDILSRHKGADIPFDIKCSRHLSTSIKKAGGIPHLCRGGHSLMKAKLIELNAPLAGEMSGHIFFQENWFGFDDGLYAAARLLALLSADHTRPEFFFDRLPKTFSTPEIKITVDEAEKFELIATLIKKAEEQFPQAQFIKIDGLRMEFKHGWGLVRASNTTACLTLRFEADTPEALSHIQSKFRSLLKDTLPPEAHCPF